MLLRCRAIETSIAMAAATTSHRNRGSNPEGEQLIRWRFAQLRRSGYPDDVAAEIAARRDIDLHRATSLVQAGCPPDTAVRILL